MNDKDIEKAQRIMNVYGEVYIRMVHSKKCPYCDAPVRDKNLNWIIPVYYIGEDPVGYMCNCGKCLSYTMLLRYEIETPSNKIKKEQHYKQKPMVIARRENENKTNERN